MSPRKIAALPLSLALAAMVAMTGAPTEGCKRSLACKGYDSCSDASPCPELRCICDGGPLAFAPTCGNDHTCFTSLDCPELCALEATKCSKPPTECAQFSPTQCVCSPTKNSFAAVWDCTKGAPGAVALGDCNKACAALGSGSGAGGAGSSSGDASSVATATASLAATGAGTSSASGG